MPRSGVSWYIYLRPNNIFFIHFVGVFSTFHLQYIKEEGPKYIFSIFVIKYLIQTKMKKIENWKTYHIAPIFPMWSITLRGLCF